MDVLCGICKKTTPNNDKIICDSCKKPYHSACTGLSRQEIQCMRVASRKLHFFCENCDISTILNSLYATVTKLQTEVDLLKANAKEVQVPHTLSILRNLCKNSKNVIVGLLI
ncbi:hypothetical protein Zmor_005432 [Zophobas morio]|uniref:PHD-type domain-containing protein n=1 Tax=Zophobas morio TaxID=2755281 RepID=A0AA38MKP1_9CUCU|nr:hypothetical protein Zmor_005432 [Zophobas morio]